MRIMVTEGFDKTSGLKHWLTAAAIAGSPMKAKATEAVHHVGKALEATARNTQTGRNVEHNVNKYLQQAGNIRLFGKAKDKVTEAAGKTVSHAAKKSGPELAINIRDGNKLQADYGKFKAHIKPGETKAQYNISPHLDVSAANHSGDKRFMVGFNKEF